MNKAKYVVIFHANLNYAEKMNEFNQVEVWLG